VEPLCLLVDLTRQRVRVGVLQFGSLPVVQDEWDNRMLTPYNLKLVSIHLLTLAAVCELDLVLGLDTQLPEQ
jgi:hypothetical protein